MNELVAFIAARLAEDEQAADTSLRFVAEAKRIEALDRRRTRNPVSRWTLDMEARANRTLAEVASKRAIISRAELVLNATWTDRDPEEPSLFLNVPIAARNLRIVLRHLASVYRDHPDWREEWAA